MRTKVTQIGTVGVDAGMLYLGNPCYVIDKKLGKMEWDEFLNRMYDSDPAGAAATHWTVRAPLPNPAYGDFPAGIVVPTGYGDGEYPVYVELTKDGRVASVTVQFISERDG